MPRVPYLVLVWLRSRLRGLPSRLRDRHFWYVHAAVFAVAGFHIVIESQHLSSWYLSFRQVTVTLYLLPIAYSSTRFGWEGGLLTSVWVTLLSIPNMVIWHREGGVWAGELAGIAIVSFVGIVLAWRAEVEARLRHRMETVLHDLALSEARYQSLFAEAGDAILVFDSEGKVASANRAAGVLTGYSNAELPGMPAASLLVPGDKGAPGKDGPILFPPSGELRLRTREGSGIYVEAVSTTLPGSGVLLTQSILRDITARRHRELGLRAFVHQVTMAQEEERKRIARELHDETAQNLALLRRELQESIRAQPEAGSETGRRLGRAYDLAGETLQGVRRFTSNLRPPVLDDLGMVPALETLVSEMTLETGGATPLEVSGTPRRLEPEAELMLFRIVQEALRNAQKHARATRIAVSVRFNEASVDIAVSDNGKGFDTTGVSSVGSSEGHLGLAGMQERAGLLGADMGVESQPGRGTKVWLHYPTGGRTLSNAEPA